MTTTNRQVVLIVSGQEFCTTNTVLEKSSWLLNPKTASTLVSNEFVTREDEASNTPVRVCLNQLGLDLDPEFFRVCLNFVRYQCLVCSEEENLDGVLLTAKQLKLFDLVRVIEKKREDNRKSAEDVRRRQLLNMFNFTGWLHAETLKEVNYNCRPVQASEVDFSGLDLSFVQAPGEAFTGMNRSNFRKANFSNCRLYGANFRGADLSYACLRNADLRKADFRDTILVGADLCGCQVEHANFIGCSFDGAKMEKLVGVERSTIHAAMHSKLNEKPLATQKKWYTPWT
ncbi:BTB/POZ domain-containing protein KCTD9 [Galdieria sulphuraria]|uniref:Potassium channel tetramerisation domain-like protein n=1 Tax=Galdieria sulphuraria TaxID=130081 RepID=M2Y610_GALSU|nr:potassium channel tetramerization domain-like protein [Galdieria sulphuraria]EME31423.1 potassium channel tetramerisation domain-like protein [Galdieria sulphuraria]GJD06577.1 BTB/POZ domain-containing protein KCTD9 [Galdieria sulphuraria]|eukprot:XP_005707943.1 potassium channel tetramerisation domain-like protein [Galdieria sulphuraria]